MPSQTGRGLPFPIGTDPVVDGDNAIRNLAEALDPVWQAMALTADWLRVDATYRNPAFRLSTGVLSINGTTLRRVTASTITPGTWYAVCQFGVDIRPVLNEVGPAGTIGVAGNVGACQWRLSTTGILAFNSCVPAGTMATGGAQGNNVTLPTMDIRIQ
jgi:hypothetical protein